MSKDARVELDALNHLIELYEKFKKKPTKAANKKLRVGITRLKNEAPRVRRFLIMLERGEVSL